jgi:asparagine N-glycosylation enzyme membrane subunit Stt3
MSKLMGAVISQTEKQVAATRFFLRTTPDIGKMAINKLTIYSKIVMTNYLEHLSINFLFISGDTSLRYFTGERGLEHIFVLPFLLCGLYFIIRNQI